MELDADKTFLAEYCLKLSGRKIFSINFFSQLPRIFHRPLHTESVTLCFLALAVSKDKDKEDWLRKEKKSEQVFRESKTTSKTEVEFSLPPQ